MAADRAVVRAPIDSLEDHPFLSTKLPAEIESAVEALMNVHGGIGRVEFLTMPRLVADYVEKAIVFTPKAEPAFFLMVAPPAYPDCVQDAFGRAEAARLALGAKAGSAVQIAVCTGSANAQSFALVPYLSPLGRGRLRRRWDKFRIRRPVLAWLRDVTTRTVCVPPENTRLESFLNPLRALSAHPDVSERVRHAARDSALALEGRQWQPRWVLAHNDLWIGNLLRRASTFAGAPDFAVIDWGASKVKGYPIYDLLSLANSINLSKNGLRSELDEHSAILGCDVDQSRHHLLTALSALSLDRGEWPVERFAATAHRFVTMLDDV